VRRILLYYILAPVAIGGLMIASAMYFGLAPAFAPWWAWGIAGWAWALGSLFIKPWADKKRDAFRR
jgi:hypothetical protein